MLNINMEPNNQDSHNTEQKKKPRGKPFEKGNKFGCTSKKNSDKASLSDYILRSTNNGKLMADFYIGVLKAIKSNKEDKQMSYNGIPITVELAKSANEWLTNNSLGKPIQRKPDNDNEGFDIEKDRKFLKDFIKKIETSDLETIKLIKSL